MLLELEVKNFALIDELYLQFEKGLNILTGETGAGKSIIIDAVNMAIGERADREFVRSGTNKCTVQALFGTEGTVGLESVLEEYGIENNQEQTLVVTREIYANGRSVCRVNGTIVTQGILKNITQKLIDIHGQHQHQSLLNPQAHVDLLDAYGGQAVSQLLGDISEGYKTLLALRGQLNSICSNEIERERKIDLLKFQIQEVRAAELKSGEEEELNQRKDFLANGEKIFKTVAEAYGTLYEGDEFSPLLDQLSKTVTQLHQISSFDHQLTYFYQSLEDIQYKIQDITRDMRDYRDQIDFDPESLNEVEKRLDIINNLKRKYGKSVEEVLGYYHKIEKELELYENSEAEILRLKKSIEKKQLEIEEKALILSGIRKTIATNFQQELTKILENLNMGKVSFDVSFSYTYDSNQQYKLSEKGIDTVEFMISTNLGEPLKPLAKIASGGEMSRIMLALKTILANVDHIPTLIFDEIDTGISGRTAQVVGQNLYDLSRNYQIICITHLPQIASLADRHFFIEKKESGGTTKTEVNPMNIEERIREVGRLLGGELTEITLTHAKELLNKKSPKRKS
ncbi:DNA repair protein RecN [Alkaliphilus hydrothermalis]|uniref:DNA repair protein RecN n=1 Tax=Alkaliphilus hydrothermalis TaxID=1482730 RepID=A0ABS2NM44_9FIRM|nr:DNA repair protein RecN [Alkaliphilus hydrothermalis]MBM7614015.1 DNA repair protein RecN (Recombination protein N) [Alkaliphilus hydrothermalis]